jgi:hypothetical protein
MSPCLPNSNIESLLHFKLSSGICPVNETKVCQILQQNTLKVILNDAVIIDTSFANVFQESLTLPCHLWPGGLNSIQIWWRHQRLPNFDDIQLQITTSCSSKMTLPSSLWFHSTPDAIISGQWPRRIAFEGSTFKINSPNLFEPSSPFSNHLVFSTFLYPPFLTSNRKPIKAFQKCIYQCIFDICHCWSVCLVLNNSDRQLRTQNFERS